MVWTPPVAPTTGTAITVAYATTNFVNNLKAIGDAWTAYTPAWTGTTTNPVIGNGTLQGNYAQAGKLVFFRIFIQAGSTTTFGSGTYRVSLPVAAIGAGFLSPGNGQITDTGSSQFYRFAALDTSTTVSLRDLSAASWTPTVPFTFANTDTVQIAGAYEAA